MTILTPWTPCTNCPKEKPTMTNDQKQDVQWSVNYAHNKLQEIEAGKHPNAQELRDRRMLADLHLTLLLKKVQMSLPKDLREQVQACLSIREQVWSMEYYDAYYAQLHAQKETSPTSLPALDSF